MGSSLRKFASSNAPRPGQGTSYSNGRKAKRVELLSGKVFNVAFLPTSGSEEELVEAAYLASLPDRSQEAQAVYFGALCSGVLFNSVIPEEAHSFLSDNRISGMAIPGQMIRKGSLEAVESWIASSGGIIHMQARELVAEIRARGNRAIVVACDRQDIGVIELS